MIPEGLKRFFLSRNLVLAAYLAAAVGASVVQYVKGHPGERYTRYNNYLIFRESSNHLAQGKDLYVTHEKDHFDLYKYSPAFAVLFTPFGKLGDLPGLIAWNLLNALPVCLLMLMMPAIGKPEKYIGLWIILLELITSLQNSQSNGLVTAMALGAFLCFEKKNVFVASLLIVASGYIKIFGLVTALLFVFYDNRVRFLAYAAGWTILFAALPLLVTTPGLLGMQYQSWLALLMADGQASDGISIYGLIYSVTGGIPGKSVLLVSGIVLLLLPACMIRRYQSRSFRLLYFAGILIWMVIFNHRAESPTFVIAIAGVALWYAISKRRPADHFLLLIALVFTVLSPTDLFPRFVRDQWVVPFSLKALPCVLVWIKINYELLSRRRIRAGT